EIFLPGRRSRRSSRHFGYACLLWRYHRARRRFALDPQIAGVLRARQGAIFARFEDHRPQMLAAAEIGEVRARAGDHQIIAAACVALVFDADVVLLRPADDGMNMVERGLRETHCSPFEEKSSTVLQAAFKLAT